MSPYFTPGDIAASLTVLAAVVSGLVWLLGTVFVTKKEFRQVMKERDEKIMSALSDIKESLEVLKNDGFERGDKITAAINRMDTRISVIEASRQLRRERD